MQHDATGKCETQQHTLTDRSAVQPPQLWQSKQPSLCLAPLQLLIHIPQYSSRQYCTQGEGLQQQHFIYSFVQQKLFFSTMVVAQGVFQTWLEKLTSWYSQEQLAGRKATPAVYTAGEFFAWVSLSGEILSTTRQTALLQDSPSQLSPSSTHIPRRA